MLRYVNTDEKSPICIPICNRISSAEDLYTLMLSIRTFELSILNMFDEGILAGTTHTSLGQEASSVGIVSSIDRDKDIIFGNHRSHGHVLSYCGEIERLYLEIMGKPGGLCAGRGGSQHLHYKNFYSNGIQGGIVPVSTGMALAEKMKGSQSIVVVFLGDGTLGQGVVYESFNIASLWSLPILFVIENNGYAQTTPCRLQVAGSMSKRPEAFDISVEEISSTDVCEILSVASKAVDFIRSESRPYCLLLHTIRLGPHSKGDDHRSEEEIEELKKLDPLKIMEAELDALRISRVKENVLQLVNMTKESALKEPKYDIA